MEGLTMRIRLLAVAALVLSLGLGSHSLGQVDPNQNPFGGIMQQLQENMNNAGVTPRDVLQNLGQQIQEGTFDPQAFQQQLQESGIINQGMLDQFNQLRNQFQNQNPNRNQFGNSQRQMTTLQALLNAGPDEWTVLSPRIQRVIDLSNDYNQAVNNPQIIQPNVAFAAQQQPALGPVGAALADLRNLLQNPDASDSNVKEKLGAYREARKRVASDLATARAELVNILTLRQEGILMNMLIVE
jgi:hypothetical protein